MVAMSFLGGDKHTRSSATSYGKAIIEKIRQTVPGGGLIVLLGLGGGSIGGDILCFNGKASNYSVVLIEIDENIIRNPTESVDMNVS